ncbi:MAG TPA: A/G-specific adenine glycosylase [Micropepsaceae bacterium]|nr:A/G-specific adenine glycosylase [Micropepsaceae bacterium]
MQGAESASAAEQLLSWYDRHRRDLPWRAKPGHAADPYRVWVSEIMLQQTTVAAVIGYFDRFIRRWPDVTALALAPLDEVLAQWAGLGYYARARNLHRGACFVAERFGGVMPRQADQLIEIPGIGPYTANAIAAIAFGEPVPAIDTNAERVMSRYLAFSESLPGARAQLTALVAELVPQRRPGDFAQALMDLGSSICTPENPGCASCPLSLRCKARRQKLTRILPRKEKKAQRRVMRALAFVAIDDRGAVYLIKRAETGLFGGMMQPPLTPLQKNFPPARDAMSQAPFHGEWRLRPGIVKHTLTHIELEVRTYVAQFAARPNGEGIWLAPGEFKTAALPTAMRKMLRHALAAEASLPCS